MSLYAWGSNKFNQLASASALHTYGPCGLAFDFHGKTPLQIAAGDGHSLALCDSGDIYSFGRDREGQLGHGDDSRKERADAKLVVGLDNVTVTEIAAGSLTSYAVTTTGLVYHWGLIHRSGDFGGAAPDDDEEQTGSEGVQSGQLTGLAQDQNTIVVERDLEARQSSATTSNDNQSRHLRDIVRDSTERWQLPTADADREYYEELRAMGYQVEDAEEKLQERGKEYHGMLKMGCRRYPRCTPLLISLSRKIPIAKVASGYAHAMLLARSGQLYAAGYNDRGQLGLGHRINTSEFKHVDFLANKFVVQVACGQQHTICRAVDQGMVDAGFITVGSDVGADAYVWGNGVLGQLGIGRRGTSKGRLFPTLNSSLHQQFPQGIVDVAAGANFTVTVTISGAVFSFGHAEYNQHGKGYQSYSDYTDPFYYFEPRQVNIESQLQSYRWEQSNDNEPAKPQVFMKRVVCGTVFSVGIDANGDIYSWGWNESGVLGHGYNHFASAPSRIEAIGTHADAQMVTAIAAGGKHILCLTGSYGDPWAKSYRTVLEFPLYYDCALVVPDTQQTLPCHLALLSARCPYLKGFIRAASEQHNCDRKIVQIELPSTAANAVTLRSLMNYIYMDRAQIANHKKRELLQLAEDLHLSPLIRIMTFTKDDNTKSTSLSTFTADIKKIFNNQEYADLLLVVSPDATLIGSSASSGSVETLDTEGIVEVQGLRKLSILYAHKAVVHHIPYFETLFTGNFADSSVYIDKSDGSGRKIQIVDMDGFIMDGIDTDTLLKVFSYAYTGQFGLYSNADTKEEEDLDVIMNILIAANRLAFQSLIQYCERMLSLHLSDFYPNNAVNCLKFAQAYDMVRLERQCLDLLSGDFSINLEELLK